MADFNLPFATNGERREPTSDEQDSGFGCGPASLPLFNWMFWAIQSEINAVILNAGLTPDNGDMTQLLQAIQELIEAATGGGDTSSYLTITQARARLPIFPEVLNTNAHFGVTSPGTGQVRVPSGVNFQHRGIYPQTTVQTDLPTDASKTYHLRWNPTDGFALKDLSGSGYNPTAAAETDPKFDSTYDDMLVARVVTNSSNVPTITNLVNLNRLMSSQGIAATNIVSPFTNNARGDIIAPLNWARTPKIKSFTELMRNFGSGSDFDQNLFALGTTTAISELPGTRYQIAYTIQQDYVGPFNHQVNAEA